VFLLENKFNRWFCTVIYLLNDSVNRLDRCKSKVLFLYFVSILLFYSYNFSKENGIFIEKAAHSEVAEST